MFALTIPRTSMKMGHVRSKTRSFLRITVQKAQVSKSRAIMALLLLLEKGEYLKFLTVLQICKILELSKLRGFEDGRLNMAHLMEFKRKGKKIGKTKRKEKKRE